MIAGIGIDMIELHRVERALARFGTRFLERMLSSAERQGMHGNDVAYVAGRVAAKEAGVKALGTGIAGGVGWKDIEIVNRPSGAPRIRYRAAAQKKMRAMGVVAAHLTLSHSQSHAVALVVLETLDVSGTVPARWGM